MFYYLWWVNFGFGCVDLSLSSKFIIRFIKRIRFNLFVYCIWFIDGKIY